LLDREWIEEEWKEWLDEAGTGDEVS